MGNFMKQNKKVKKVYFYGIIFFLLFFSSYLLYDQYNDLVELDFLHDYHAFESLDTLNASADEIKIWVLSVFLVPFSISLLFFSTLPSYFPKTLAISSFQILRC